MPALRVMTVAAIPTSYFRSLSYTTTDLPGRSATVSISLNAEYSAFPEASAKRRPRSPVSCVKLRAKTLLVHIDQKMT